MINPFLRFKIKLPKECFSFGLDIGSSMVKLVKLKLSGDKAELCNFAVEHYEDEAGLEPAVKKVVQSQDIRKVNISVSGPATIIRYVDFPKMKQDEFRQSLKFEAQKHIPFALNEVSLDGTVLKEDLPDNKMFALLAAVKKDFLEKRIKLCEDAGLKVNIIDIDSIALINAFNFNYSDQADLKGKTVALLNIGAATTNLNILEDGLPRLSRDMHIAGNSITQKIAEVLSLDLKTAEILKNNPDKERAEKMAVATESVLSNLAREIRVSFDFYESQSASSVIKIFLSGAGALAMGLKDTMKNLLGIEVDYWDPLRQISISSHLDAQNLKVLANQLAVAVGLALRR